MKILAQALPGNTISGFRLAAEAAEHEWRWWDEHREATFDVFDEFQPDVVFFMEPTRAFAKCVAERNITIVQGYDHDPFLFQVNEKTFQCGRLVDKHIFSPGDPHPAYACDIGITASPHPIGVHLCREIGDTNIKIICEEVWGVVQYLGMGSLEQKRDLYRSSTLVLVDSLVEAMRVAACGSVPINIGKKFDDAEFYERCLEAESAEEVWRFNTDNMSQHASRVNLESCITGHTYDDALGVILEEVK